MGILAIVQLLLPVLTGLLSSEGVVAPGLANLITQLASAIPTLVASLISGKGVTSDVIAVLTAIQSEVTTLKNSTTVMTIAQANLITAFDKAITDALNAYQNSKVTDDPSNLTPLPTNL